MVGEVRDYLTEGQEIVCEVTSYDIWVNLQIYYKYKQSIISQSNF